MGASTNKSAWAWSWGAAWADSWGHLYVPWGGGESPEGGKKKKAASLKDIQDSMVIEPAEAPKALKRTVIKKKRTKYELKQPGDLLTEAKQLQEAVEALQKAKDDQLAAIEAARLTRLEALAQDEEDAILALMLAQMADEAILCGP